MDLTGQEPNLQLGDFGEDVVQLQVRLYRLRFYRQFPDGTFDMATETALRELQSSTGMDNTGEMTRESWEAIAHHEQQAGLRWQYYSPYDALDQLRYDLDHPRDASGDFAAGDPALSDDGQWRWNGADWVAAGAGDAVQLSEDGQWRWNGADWVAAEAGDPVQLSEDGQWRWTGTDWVAATAEDHLGRLSPDGHWRWDGTDWVAA